MSHSYDVGTKAWQTDQTEGWVASEVTDKIVNGDRVKLIFSLVNGEVCSGHHLFACLHTDRQNTDARCSPIDEGD